MEVMLKDDEVNLETVPIGWSNNTIGNLCTTSSGTTPSRTEEERYYRNGTIYWVKTGDLTNSKISMTEELVTKTALDETSLKIYPVGTVLVAMYGGFNQIGRTGLLKVPAAVNQAITAIQTNSKMLISEYLLNVLNYHINYWKMVASSSRKDPNITSYDIKQFPINFPNNIKEQQAIATALSDVDALITSLDHLIAKKRDIKQATMQQLLTGKVRLPGFSSKKLEPTYKQTEIGMIPEDWKIEKLGNCLQCAPQYGINASAVPYTDTLPVYIRITDITDDGNFSPENIVSVKHISAEKYVLNVGDFVFARTGASVGKTYLYKPKDGNLVFAGYLICIKVNPSRLLSDFLAAYVKTEHYWNWVKVMSMRSGQPGINGNEYSQLPIPLPPLPEQQAIATVLSDMDAEIAALEQKREKTHVLKQGMMQELLTGKTRLL